MLHLLSQIKYGSAQNLVIPMDHELPSLLLLSCQCLAVCWLVYRAFSVIFTPKGVLRAATGQRRFPSPEIWVEQLSDKSAVISWRYPAQAGKHAARHIVEYGTDCVDIDKGQTSLAVDNLEAGTHYDFKLFAGSRANKFALASISLETLEDPNEHPEPAQWLKPPSTRQKSEKFESMESVNQDISENECLLRREMAAREAAAEAFLKEEAQLKCELEKAARDRKNEQTARVNLRSEIQLLEDAKRALDTRRVKISKRHRELQDLFNAQHRTQNAWTNEIRERRAALKERAAEVMSGAEFRRTRETKLAGALSEVNAELASVELQSRKAAASLREAEQTQERVRALMNKLVKFVEISTGLLKSTDGLVDGEPTEYEKRILADFARDSKLEDEWTTTLSALETRYVAAYQQYESASRSFENAQAQAQQETQAQAQAYAQLAMRADEPTTGLLPSNLFGDELIAQANTSSLSAQSFGLTQSQSRTSSTYSYAPWIAHRPSRDSSMFFSTKSASIDNQSIEPYIPSTPSQPPSPEEETKRTPLADMDLDKTPTSSPEKFRWAFKSMKPWQKPQNQSFVRRLSFFRKDKHDEDEVIESMPL